MKLIDTLDKLISVAEENNYHIQYIELDMGTFCLLAVETGAAQLDMGTIEKYKGIPVHSAGYRECIRLVCDEHIYEVK